MTLGQCWASLGYLIEENRTNCGRARIKQGKICGVCTYKKEKTLMFQFKVERLSYFAGQLMYKNTFKCFRRCCATKSLRNLINYNMMQESRPVIIFSYLWMHFLLFLNSKFEVNWIWIAWMSFTPLPFFTPTVIYLVIYRIFYFNYKATTKTCKHKYKNWIWIIC